ncbi:MAG: nitroreductase family protein [Gammaproteobacteria bacterium]
MWDFFETVRHRHSIRSYRSDLPVETDKLHAVLEMACAAPSAGDLQSYRIFVINEASTRTALRRAAGDQGFISQAPVCLVYCADTRRAAGRFGLRGERLYAIQDATIAAAYSQLAIVAAGMASTWVGEFDEVAVGRILHLEHGLLPIALLSMGYPAELPAPTPRRRLDEVVRHFPD